MALLLLTPLACLSAAASLSPQHPLTVAVTTTLQISRSYKKPIDVQTKSLNGVIVYRPLFINKRHSIIVKASSSVTDGTTGSGGGEEAPSEETSMPVENLPLESKLQLKLEQKLRMKMAKKIRLRRKRLVRKRHLRKKGRWPPSKMKKNKNV